MVVHVDELTYVEIPELEYPFTTQFVDRCLDIYLVAVERSASLDMDTQQWLWDFVLKRIDPETAAAVSHVIGSYELASYST
ncbi:hypothetical protein [Chroococcidiopsis sp.]|uniref:hypothetical protein n=1 Tax=Chroococcidiopsis sp. TaxID=3088168 RepID=UPI003F3D500D